MKTFEIKLTNEVANLTVYLPDASNEMPNFKIRPAVLVIPGGAYCFCSDREAEPVALSFLSKGYAAFILRYTVGKDKGYDFSMPMADADEAMKIICDNAEEWGVNKEKIASIGFSAGGHLCAALATMGKIRPAASILLYPCILESIGRILAFTVPSLEKEVDEKTSPAFIVASREDTCVPVENSLEYVNALQKAGIPYELHVFSKGYHGFSLADNTVYSKKADIDYLAHLKCWFDMCIRWLNELFEL